MVRSLTPYDLPQIVNGGSICPQDTQMAISPQRVIRYTLCLVLGWGFRGWRIEWRYLRFEQIQDGGIFEIPGNSRRQFLGCRIPGRPYLARILRSESETSRTGICQCQIAFDRHRDVDLLVALGINSFDASRPADLSLVCNFYLSVVFTSYILNKQVS